MRREDHERIRAYLDGELDGAAAGALLDDAAGDPALSRELESQRALQRTLAGLGPPALPPSLLPSSAWRQVLGLVLGWRPVRLSMPQLAAAGAALFLAGAWLGRRNSPRSSAAGTVPVRFVFIGGDAKQVAVAGTFNGWSTDATPLRAVGDGIWEATVSLPRGEHRYIFNVDGAWQSDPLAPMLVRDGMGHLDAVLQL